MEETGQLKRALIDALAGAISGGISRMVTSPLDVIKIRFQVGSWFTSFDILVIQLFVLELLMVYCSFDVIFCLMFVRI